MKKILNYLCLIAIVFLISGCGSNKTLLNKNKPVTLSMWHVYGEQANSPFNKLIEEFNYTVGKDKGIIINVTSMTDAVKIGDELMDSLNKAPDALPMPDIFFCHKNNARNIGYENLVNFYDDFTREELNDFVPEFINDGIIEDKLVIFPVSKSTHLLFINGTRFEKFAKDTNVSYDDLKTWAGYFDVASKYYTWSGGEPFSAIDYPLRDIELTTMKYDSLFMKPDGWYDLENLNFKRTYKYFVENIINGHIIVSDKFFNTQIMTGEVVSGIGSSAAILYCNDTVTYPDNTSEETNLKVLPIPQTKDNKNYVTQAGVGLCAYKTTKQKEEAVCVFTRWLTDSTRNLEFVSKMGYMPVRKGAFEKINTFEFKNEAYKNLYLALLETSKNCIAVPEYDFPYYYKNVHKFYDLLRKNQRSYYERYKNGEDFESLVNESWDLIKNMEIFNN